MKMGQMILSSTWLVLALPLSLNHTHRATKHLFRCCFALCIVRDTSPWSRIFSPHPCFLAVCCWGVVASSSRGAGGRGSFFLDLAIHLSSCLHRYGKNEIGGRRDAATPIDRPRTKGEKWKMASCFFSLLIAHSFSPFLSLFFHGCMNLLRLCFFLSFLTLWVCRLLLGWKTLFLRVFSLLEMNCCVQLLDNNNNKTQHADRFFCLGVLCKMMHFCACFAQTNCAVRLNTTTQQTSRFSICFRPCPIFSKQRMSCRLRHQKR